jgi:hypothetical protein
MDGEHFDHLVSTLVSSGTRRRLLRFSALPLVAGLAAFLIDDSESAAKNKKKKRNKKKNCPSKEEVCAGKCGTVTYKCRGKKKTADCGACRCDVCANGCDFTSVQAAIDAADPGATIRLCLGTYAEDIEIDKDLTIVGTEPLEGVFGGTFLQGTGKNRVVVVRRGTVRLESLWITGGNGGVSNEGTLTLHRCAVLENTTSGDGGGIFNDATLEMTDCTVNWNTANNLGGGIYNDGLLKLTDCTVRGNEAAHQGGAIGNEGNLTMQGCTVSENEVGIAGGGIINKGPLTMIDCVVSENMAPESGGGLYNTAGATLTLTDCTVRGNTAFDGSGILNDNGALLEMIDCAATGNMANNRGGGIYNLGTVKLHAGTTVTENTAGDAGGGIFNHGLNAVGISTCAGGSSVSGNSPDNCVSNSCDCDCDGC